MGEKTSISFAKGRDGALESQGSLRFGDFYSNSHVALVFKLEYTGK